MLRLLDVDAPRADQIRVLAGAAFNIWEPDFAARPHALSDPDEIRTHLAAKLAKGVKVGALRLLRAEVRPMASFRWTAPRIAFRDIARATFDTRTTLVCLMPPGRAFTEMAPLIVVRRGGEQAGSVPVGRHEQHPVRLDGARVG
ncbi:hypothetical protein [Microbacterium aurum]